MDLIKSQVLEEKYNKMKIDIDISKEDCISLLKENGYDNFQKILGWWNADDRDETFKNRCSCYVDCVFHKNDNSPLFKEKHPLIENVREHSVETVISKLFNKKILQLINKH